MNGRIAVIAAVLAVAAGGTVLVARGGDSRRRTAVPIPAPRTAAVSVRDEESARAAALAYVAGSQEWLYLTDEATAAAVRRVSTPAGGDRLAAQVLGGVRTARQALRGTDGRVWWIVRPLAWRVESFAGSQATVSVWAVSVLAAAGVAAPQADWTTVVVDLVLVGGSWLVDAVGERSGPTPMVGPKDRPWDAAGFDAQLAGFHRVGSEVR